MALLTVTGLPLWHPGDSLPHPAGFEIPPLLFWALSLMTLILVAWIAIDLRRSAVNRGHRGPAPSNVEGELADSEPLIVGRPRGGNLGPVRALPRPAEDIEPLVVAPARLTSSRVSLNPVRLLVTTLGIGLGIVATERAREVQALASLVQSDNAAQVSRLALAFAVLMVIGGSLAISAPRAAAVVLLVGGGLALFLSFTPDLATRLRWWDAGYVLQPWEALRWWAGGCTILACLAWFSVSYRLGHDGSGAQTTPQQIEA